MPTYMDEHDIPGVTAGHDNKTGRQIAIYRDSQLNEGAFVALIRAIVANNRAGGWRKLQG